MLGLSLLILLISNIALIIYGIFNLTVQFALSSAFIIGGVIGIILVLNFWTVVYNITDLQIELAKEKKQTEKLKQKLDELIEASKS
jgi:uncharacterized membrane-anchored protein YhcB (DUF1043 family)